MAANGSGPSEADTISSLVLPALAAAGWRQEQIEREYFLRASTVTSESGATSDLGRGFADMVLEATPGTPVAVVEAKREYRTAQEAITQAIRYARQVDAPLAYGANGRTIIERNLRTGRERQVEAFAPPAAAWDEYRAHHRLDEVAAGVVAQPFDRHRLTASGEVVRPRPYQVVAINRVLAAIARGDQRALLLMATGTGKTFTAMQIVAKLRAWEAVRHPDRNYRVLYLADRDALLDQPMRKDFRPAFGNEPLLRVRGGADFSREIYFASYQALTGGSDDTGRLLEYPPDFFDLVVVDECHRGSAAEDSRWRRVLDRFTSAVQLGLTATPRNDTVHSYEYFGNPVFEYSLRDGVEQGYLAPYRVRRVVLTPDAEGWQPSQGERDRLGREIPDGVYSTRDFERALSLRARTELVARHLSNLLHGSRRPKAMVFCVDTEHAADMRQALIDANPDRVRADPEWVVRIVGIEPDLRRLLDDFCDPTRTTPAIATTSRLLSTGVDVEDLTHVVLFRPVGSMIEFKQIIGRGTRLYPDAGKTSFEIVDYVGASARFSDPAFDGYPAAITLEHLDDEGVVVASEAEDPVAPPGLQDDGIAPASEPVAETVELSTDSVQVRRKYYVDSGDFAVRSESTLVPDRSSGILQLTELGAMLGARIRALGDQDRIRHQWAHVDSRHRLQQMLADSDVDLAEIVAATGVPGVDALDALNQLAWNLPVQTRAERVRRVRETHAMEISDLEAQARAVLEGLLHRYEQHGVADLETTAVFRLEPLRELGSVVELAQAAGGRAALQSRLDQVQEWLYSA